MKKHGAIGVVALLGVFCCLAAVSAQTPPASEAEADRARIDAGKRLFADTCQNDHCHGGSARNMEDRAGFTAEYLRRVINEGVPDAGMQAFKDVFTPDQVEQLVAYILSVAPHAGAGAARTAPRLVPAHAATNCGELSGDATAGRPARELFRRIVTRDNHMVARMPTDEYASTYSLTQLLDLVAFLKSPDRSAVAGVTLKDLF